MTNNFIYSPFIILVLKLCDLTVKSPRISKVPNLLAILRVLAELSALNISTLTELLELKFYTAHTEQLL